MTTIGNTNRYPRCQSAPSRRRSAVPGRAACARSAGIWATVAMGPERSALLASSDLVDFLDAAVRFLQRRLERQPGRHDAPGHVAEHVLRLHLDRRGRDRAGIARPHAAHDVLQHALVVRIALPVRMLGAGPVHGTRLAAARLHVLLEPLLVLDPADHVLGELVKLRFLEDAPVVGAGEHERAGRPARREDHLRLVEQRVILGAHRIVEAGAVVRAHELAGHVRLVVAGVVPAHDTRRLNLVLLDRVHGELERRHVRLEVRGRQRRLAVLVPGAPAVIPENVLHEAVAVVAPVQRLTEAPDVLRRILALLGDVDHVGVVHLRHLDALLGEQVLADVQAAAEGQARDAEVLAVELDDAIGIWQEAAARGGEVLGQLGLVAERRLVAHRSLVVHLGDVGRVAGLDGGDELLLAVAEGGPVELGLDVALLGPRLDVLGEDVVAGGHVALEEPDAELGLGLRRRHAAQHGQAGGGSAGEHRRFPEKLAPADQARVELGGEPLQPRVGRDHFESLASFPLTPQFDRSTSWKTICTWSAVVLPIFTIASVIAAVISRFCWSVRPAYHWIVMFGMASLLTKVGSWQRLWQWAARRARQVRPRTVRSVAGAARDGGRPHAILYTRRTFSQSIFDWIAGGMPRNCSSIAFCENGQVPSRCG